MSLQSDNGSAFKVAVTQGVSKALEIEYHLHCSWSSPLSSWKDSCGGHRHFKKKTFSKSANTFDNNHMWCLFFIWWHLPTIKWTGATLCTLTMDIMWLLILILIVLFLLFAPCICNCVTGFVSSRMKAFKFQMVAQTPATAATSSNYCLGPLDQISSIWGLGEYVASPI